MQTHLAESIRETEQGRAAERILRSCVHCGFCNATCPTYQLLGDELDGPRGRIYLIKQVLEGRPATRKTQIHLDRCLTCRSCETTCPSGVRYGRLLDIGRSLVEASVARGRLESLIRKSLRWLLPFPNRISPLIRLAQKLLPVLPAGLRSKVPRGTESPGEWPDSNHPRKMVVLNGCVQPVAAPQIDRAAARVLERIGISLVRIPEGGCCGALSHHLGRTEEGLQFARRNIDAWWPAIEAGAEQIVITASGCAVMVKDYAELLREDRNYAEKAERVSHLAKDLAEVLISEDRSRFRTPRESRIAFHSPCTLQHGQKLNGVVEKILSEAGFQLTPVENPHLCCGSAGTYSILQQSLSSQLLAQKIEALEKDHPDLIATANIGCLLSIQSASELEVKHWVELLAD
ncbi:MAG: glycolate oxidase subunit GlcF [Gammaproteobacteria bacterium]